MGKRLFPAEVVASLRAGADTDALAKAGFKALPGASYRSMWSVPHNDHGAFAALGVHGQTVYIDPTSLPADHAVARYPLSKEETVK